MNIQQFKTGLSISLFLCGFTFCIVSQPNAQMMKAGVVSSPGESSSVVAGPISIVEPVYNLYFGIGQHAPGHGQDIKVSNNSGSPISIQSWNVEVHYNSKTYPMTVGSAPSQLNPGVVYDLKITNMGCKYKGDCPYEKDDRHDLSEEDEKDDFGSYVVYPAIKFTEKPNVNLKVKYKLVGQSTEYVIDLNPRVQTNMNKYSIHVNSVDDKYFDDLDKNTRFEEVKIRGKINKGSATYFAFMSFTGGYTGMVYDPIDDTVMMLFSIWNGCSDTNESLEDDCFRNGGDYRSHFIDINSSDGFTVKRSPEVANCAECNFKSIRHHNFDFEKDKEYTFHIKYTVSDSPFYTIDENGDLLFVNENRDEWTYYSVWVTEHVGSGDSLEDETYKFGTIARFGNIVPYRVGSFIEPIGKKRGYEQREIEYVSISTKVQGESKWRHVNLNDVTSDILKVNGVGYTAESYMTTGGNLRFQSGGQSKSVFEVEPGWEDEVYIGQQYTKNIKAVLDDGTLLAPQLLLKSGEDISALGIETVREDDLSLSISWVPQVENLGGHTFIFFASSPSGDNIVHQDVPLVIQEKSIISPEPGSLLKSSEVTFQWNRFPDDKEYFIHIGTEEHYAAYGFASTIENNATVTTVPLNGENIYVSLWRMKHEGSLDIEHYTYKTASAPVVSEPSIGSILDSQTINFMIDRNGYTGNVEVRIGTSLGAIDIHHDISLDSSGIVTATSDQFIDGGVIYVQLLTLQSGQLVSSNAEFQTEDQIFTNQYISGTVLDRHNRPKANHPVRIQRKTRGGGFGGPSIYMDVEEVLTDSAGRYQSSELQRGRYRVVPDNLNHDFGPSKRFLLLQNATPSLGLDFKEIINKEPKVKLKKLRDSVNRREIIGYEVHTKDKEDDEFNILVSSQYRMYTEGMSDDEGWLEVYYPGEIHFSELNLPVGRHTLQYKAIDSHGLESKIRKKRIRVREELLAGRMMKVYSEIENTIPKLTIKKEYTGKKKIKLDAFILQGSDLEDGENLRYRYRINGGSWLDVNDGNKVYRDQVRAPAGKHQKFEAIAIDQDEGVSNIATKLFKMPK